MILFLVLESKKCDSVVIKYHQRNTHNLEGLECPLKEFDFILPNSRVLLMISE